MSTTSITSGTYFVGKTLIIGSTGTSNTNYARVVEFNNNSNATYLGVMFSATINQPWFSFRPLNQAWDEPPMPWTASLNVYYIYVFSFISDIQVKYNIYEYNGASTIISKGTIYTYNAASAFLQNLTQFWLGRTIWGQDFYNGRYDKVALYNGDLFALSDANILSNLLTLVTSPRTNIINNSTYTFRSLGTNFLGVVVDILNFNTAIGSTVTTSNITLIGTGSTSGGYLNIIGSYTEPVPYSLNTPNKQWLMYLNTLSSISSDDLTIKPDNARNLLLEVSANNNIFMKKGTTLYNLINLITGDVSFSNIDVSQNLNSLLPNKSSLGLHNKVWGNAYIRDISITNMSISGSFISNVRQIIPQNDISTSLGNSLNMWQKAFIRDLSGITSINGSNWPVTGPTGANGPTGPTGAIGPAGRTITATWSDISNLTLTTYHRIYQNIGKKPIYELNTNIQSWDWHKTNAESLGKTLATILNAAQNEEVRLILAGNAAFLGGIRTANSSLTGITSADWLWANGDTWSYTNFASGEPNGGASQPYIQMYANGQWDDINVNFSMRAVYMSYVEDPSWSSVNGYYGLAKDAYPSLNPYSSAVKAVQTWTIRTASEANEWFAICWSPELRLFVSLAANGTATNRIMTSTNGINWTTRTSIGNDNWRAVCWSPELRIFAAVAQIGTNFIMTSPDGITWTGRTTPVGLAGEPNSICWSSELRIFVAVCYRGNVITSSDGTTWISQTVPSYSGWYSVCWSPELRLFVAVAYDEIHKVMTSSDGIYWTARTAALGGQSNKWSGVCWSAQLGIFVAVGDGTTCSVMTSNNGIDWISRTGRPQLGDWWAVCWSPQLEIFVAVCRIGTNPIMTSPNGIDWTIRTSVSNAWWAICWSPELGIFAITAGYQATGTNTVLTSSLKGCPPTSYNLFDNTSIITSDNAGPTGWTYEAWTNDASIGLDSTSIYTVAVDLGNTSATTVNGVPFQANALSGTNFYIEGQVNYFSGSPTGNFSGTGVALASNFIYGASQRTITLTNLTFGVKYKTSIFSVAWDYDAVRNQTFTASNGPSITINPNIHGLHTGIIINYTFVADNTGTQVFTITAVNTGWTFHLYALANRRVDPVFTNISTNSIDENGKWTFQNMDVTTMTAGGSNVTSDDRLKHNEVVIANGLDIIDKLTPKFYQKTQVLLDASYNGDLSDYVWNYEAGLIAQEVLQIRDISYVVGGGDYYEPKYIYNRQTNDLSYNYYEAFANYYEISANNYEISGNNYEVSANYYEISTNNYEVSANYYEISANYQPIPNNYEISANYQPIPNNYEVSYNLITRAYNLNYNSVFVYGLAAIKELHTKVKAQDSTILNQKNIINSLLARIQTLEK